jgi:hypothetical protein
MNRPIPWSSAAVAISPFSTLERAKEAEKAYKRNESIGFTATSSLKSMGRIPRSSGLYEVGDKYKPLLQKKK